MGGEGERDGDWRVFECVVACTTKSTQNLQILWRSVNMSYL